MPPRQLRLHTLRLSALPFFRSLLDLVPGAYSRSDVRSQFSASFVDERLRILKHSINDGPAVGTHGRPPCWKSVLLSPGHELDNGLP